MVRLLLRKLLRVAASLLGVTLIVFLLMHAIPGSPWDNYSSAQTLSFGATSDNGFSTPALPQIWIGPALVAPIHPLCLR